MEKIKILVVDDKQEDIDLLKNYLDSKEFLTIPAKNGFEGVYLFDKDSPQIVILDWNMPGLSGIEVLQNMKRKKPEVPVIILSVGDTVEHKRAGFQAGCDDYLTKPCDLDELYVRIQNLLKKYQVTPKGRLVYGEIVLDQEAHRVTRAGEAIELSVTEYTLLEYLLQNVDKVLSRKMILEHVWGTENPETFTNIVDVYMNYLRKKLDLPGKRSFIKTVRGFGYMLEDLSIRKAA